MLISRFCSNSRPYAATKRINHDIIIHFFDLHIIEIKLVVEHAYW